MGALEVVPGEQMMLISNRGTLVRTRVDEVSQVGRNTQGVTLIRTADDEVVVGLQRIADSDTDAVEGEEVDANDVAGNEQDDNL